MLTGASGNFAPGLLKRQSTLPLKLSFFTIYEFLPNHTGPLFENIGSVLKCSFSKRAIFQIQAYSLHDTNAASRLFDHAKPACVESELS